MSECDWVFLGIYIHNVCLCLSVTGCDCACLVIYNVCICLRVTGVTGCFCVYIYI